MIRTVLIATAIGMCVITTPSQAQPLPSVSAACEVYQTYLNASWNAVPMAITIAAKKQATALVAGACDQPSHAPNSALPNITKAANMLAVAAAPYWPTTQGTKP